MIKIFRQYASLGFLLFIGCSTAPKPQSLDSNWYSRMHRLSEAMTKLMPLASDNQKFFDPKNGGEIQKNLTELAEASKQLTQDQTGPKDPLVAHTAKIFAQDMAYAKNQFSSGNVQMAQFIVSNVPNYCISCHTRTDRGTKDFPMNWAVNLNKLSGPQKTQYYLANRQYGAAVKEVNSVVKNGKLLKADPISWRTAVERTLAMLVRVEKNVEQSKKIVQSIVQNPSAPSYIRYDAVIWLKDIQQWQQSLAGKQKKLSDRQKYRAAVRLLEQGQVLQTPQSHSPLISSLRASALLHEILENPKSGSYAEALYSAGIASEFLRDLTVWSLNETYYESCIRAQPHSPLAEKCYAQLEASVHRHNFPNAEDTEISGVESARLRELSELSEVKVYQETERVQRLLEKMGPKGER